MASDDEPMKVSIQPRDSTVFTWQMLVFILTMAIGFGALEIVARQLIPVENLSPRGTALLVIALGPLGVFGSKLRSIRTFMSMVGVYVLAGIVCYSIVWSMTFMLVDVEPRFLNRFLTYLPVVPLMLLVLPRIVAKVPPRSLVQKSTLKPLTIAMAMIAIAGVLAGGDWLFDVLTQASS